MCSIVFGSTSGALSRACRTRSLKSITTRLVGVNLNPDGSWKELASTGEGIGEAVGLDKDRLEYLVDTQTQHIQGLQSEIEQLRGWSGGDDANGANVALSSLLRIVSDNTASPRQRIRAAGAVLGYRVQDDSAVEFTKRFLQSVCESTDIAIDYKIEAGELLRRHEAPRVVSETIRPTYRDTEKPKEPPIPLLELVRQRRERADRMQAEMIRQHGWRDNSTGGNRSDEHSDKLSGDIPVDC